MKKNLLSLLLIAFAIVQLNAQGLVNQPIVATGGIEIDTIFIEDENENIIDTIPISFPTSSDDAEQENDEIDALFDDDIDSGWEGEDGDANILTAGLRFQDIAIPKSATIDSAYILVYSHEGKYDDDVAKITIYGDNSDNAPTFTEDSLITDRTATTAEVKWTVEEEWIIWKPYRTPDLKDIVQEIVNRDGWASGNAMVFILQGENQGPSLVENAREWESFENISDPEEEDPDGNPGDAQNHSERVPRLIVYWGGFTSAIKDINVKTLNVFPNPVNNNSQITVNFENNATASVTLVDLTGKVIKTEIFTSKQALINLTNIEKGIYLIKAIQNNTIYTQKVVVE